MGAHKFKVLGHGQNAQEAYLALVENATREYGTDRYNGTISTTSGFRMIELPPGKNIHKLIANILDSFDNEYDIAKFGKAGCIELKKGEELAKAKKRHGIKGSRFYAFFGWAAC